MPIQDLTKMTKDELLRFAGKKKIPVKKSLLKKEILSLLKRETKKTAKLAEAKKGKAAGKKVVAAKAEKKTSAKKVKTKAAKPKVQKTLSKTSLKKKVKRPAQRKKTRVASSASQELQGSKGYDVHALQPKFELEDMAQEAKFILGKPDIRDESRVEVSPELPLGYGDNKIVMLVRDPNWCYLYWELQEGNIEDGLRRLSRSRSEVRHVLRFHPAQGEETFFDVDVDFRHRSHYQKLSPGASFYAEIGLMDQEGHFAALAVSNTVTLPLDGPSEIIDEQWITTDENFTELYLLSGGEMAGQGKARGDFGQAGSAGLQTIEREQLHLSGVSSFGSAKIQEPRRELNFGYWLDAELILYGGADMGATIELSGKKLELRPDGTFTARFGLPEGELELPVTFVSPDRATVQTVTPNIRHTKTETGGSDQ
jgi:hypothetical protein